MGTFFHHGCLCIAAACRDAWLDFFSWAVEASLLGCRAGFPINDPLRICFRHQIFWQINLLISWTQQTKTTWKNIVQGRYPYEAFVPRPKLLTCLRWFSRNRARQIKYLLRNLWDIVRPWQSLATLFARPNHDSSSKQWKQKGLFSTFQFVPQYGTKNALWAWFWTG